MRVIGQVQTEKQAFVVYSYLLQMGIHSSYEKDESGSVSIWIYEENLIDQATEVLELYKANPQDPRFANTPFPEAPPQPPDTIAQDKEKEANHAALRPRKLKSYPLTYGVILLCVFLFFWSSMQLGKMVKEDGKVAALIGMTPIQQKLMFDYPVANQEIDAILKNSQTNQATNIKELPPEVKSKVEQAETNPTWGGILGKIMYSFQKEPNPDAGAPLFVKIKEGELWRLFTPCLLHGNFLHILFNMLWAWLLLKQIEDRLPMWKSILLIVLIGIAANVAQYFMSGPFFVGFSGVVCGVVGFIWIRQKDAPWEGYPLHKSTILFIVIFIAAMFFLELFLLGSALIKGTTSTANIANTAHIVGGLTGIALGKLPLFSRGIS